MTDEQHSAFWGDSTDAISQFLNPSAPPVDYVVADYLAELTMGLLARSSRSRSGSKGNGYISEFLDLILVPHLDQIVQKGIKIVANAGGLDPVGLKAAIEEHVESRGLGHAVRVAAIYGDDLVEQQDALHKSGAFGAFDPLNCSVPNEGREMHGSDLLSLNAYLGGEPITKALQTGATIVVTGRIVDSALVVGPLAHEFNWDYSFSQTSLDRLASASLAGHIIECGAQATGGNYTDWKTSAFSQHGGWSNMGYPILTFHEDNSFLISKPDKTGGVVSEASVCEQMLYEVLDPGSYLLPDLALDMRNVELQTIRPGVVVVKGARGSPPTPWLKCTSVEQKGFRITVDILVCGEEAELKAEALGHAILTRTNTLAAKRFRNKYPQINQENSEVILIGAERSLQPLTHLPERREIALRVAAKHESRAVLDILGKEVASFLTNSCPGICLLTSGRPRPSPNFSATSVLVRRNAVVPKVAVGGMEEIVEVPFLLTGCREASSPGTVVSDSRILDHDVVQENMLRTKLHTIAVGRSGDKGDAANVAIIARDPKFYPYILEQVTAEVVHTTFKHFISEGGSVTRYEVPGVYAINFVLTKALGGGGLSSLRLDRQAKSYAQIALSAITVHIPVNAGVRAQL